MQQTAEKQIEQQALALDIDSVLFVRDHSVIVRHHTSKDVTKCCLSSSKFLFHLHSLLNVCQYPNRAW